MKNQAHLPDCPEWHINKAWRELDNDGVVELLNSVSKIHIYDIYAGEEGILAKRPYCSCWATRWNNPFLMIMYLLAVTAAGSAVGTKSK